MKMKLFLTVALVLGLNYHHWAQTRLQHPGNYSPLVEVVVTQDRIWFMLDEKPLEDMPVKIQNVRGETVLEKTLLHNLKEWSIDVSELPQGKYKILIGAGQTEYLDKQSKRKVL